MNIESSIFVDPDTGKAASFSPLFDGPFWHNNGGGHAYHYRCLCCGSFTLSEIPHTHYHQQRHLAVASK